MKCYSTGLVTISQSKATTRFGNLHMPLKPVVISLLFVAALIACEQETREVSSTIIVNATIHDGSGGSPLQGSVRIDGDRIVEFGELRPLAGEVVIDAGGLVLAPGFIDTHSHHDGQMDVYRHMPGVLSQGVTTIARGLDGFSDDSDQGTFLTLIEFNERFAAAPAAVNVVSFSPHNSIRRYVMGADERRIASADEIKAMSELIAADMAAGALGLATGLEYEPGIYSSTEEVIELARVAARFGGRYASHVRDEDDLFSDAVQEILRIAREANLPVHISHIKLADRDFWGTSDSLLRTLNDARAEGINVTADIYPYQRWESHLGVLFPKQDFSDEGVAQFTFAHTASPEDIVVSYFAPNPEFNGLSVAEIAAITESDPVSTLLDLAQAADDYAADTGQRGSSIIAKGMDEGDVAALMQWEFTNICSDGDHGGGHPRGYGAFPRVLARFVRELGMLSLEDAIYKMTGLSATTLGIKDRGRIREGYYADLVLFDPDKIEDKATMQNPTALSIGVEKVWVNGVLAFDNHEPTLVYPGRSVSRSDL